MHSGGWSFVAVPDLLHSVHAVYIEFSVGTLCKFFHSLVYFKLVYACQIKKSHIMHVSSVAHMHTVLLQVSEI